MEEKPTEELDNVLKHTDLEGIDEYLEDYQDELIRGPEPFSTYFKGILKENGITQQELIERADMTKYGLEVLSQRKHSGQRDCILRLCFAAELNLDQTQRALKLYGMPELYSRLSRDAVLMILFNQGVHDIQKVNENLESHGEERLSGKYFSEEPV